MLQPEHMADEFVKLVLHRILVTLGDRRVRTKRLRSVDNRVVGDQVKEMNLKSPVDDRHLGSLPIVPRGCKIVVDDGTHVHSTSFELWAGHTDDLTVAVLMHRCFNPVGEVEDEAALDRGEFDVRRSIGRVAPRSIVVESFVEFLSIRRDRGSEIFGLGIHVGWVRRSDFLFTNSL